jgi:hypothetical protein
LGPTRVNVWCSEDDGENRDAIDCKTKEKSENEMDVFAIARGYEKANKNGDRPFKENISLRVVGVV